MGSSSKGFWPRVAFTILELEILTTAGNNGSTTAEKPSLRDTGPTAGFAAAGAIRNSTGRLAPSTGLLLDVKAHVSAPPTKRATPNEIVATERLILTVCLSICVTPPTAQDRQSRVLAGPYGP